MTAFALDGNHDVFLRGGQIALAEGPDFVVQAIRTRLLLYRGEWWLDTASGVPWFQEILKAPANIPRTESTLRRTILETPGVTGLTLFDLTFDRARRDLRVTFEVQTEFGPSGVEVVSIA